MGFSLQDVINPITITNYGKNVVDGVLQYNPLFRLIAKKGNIQRSMGGTNFTWELEAGRHDVQIVSDDQDVSTFYTPRKRFAQPALNWGQIAVFRRFGKGQLRQNYGNQALVNFRKKEIPAMFRDAIDANPNGLAYQILNQSGNGYTGPGLPIWGLPSAFTAVAWTSGNKEGSFTAAGNYATLPLASGAMSAQVDGAQADAWTPTAINTTSTAWPSATTGGFGALVNSAGQQLQTPNPFAILSYAWARADRIAQSNDPNYHPDCFLLNQQDFISFETALVGKQTFLLNGKVSDDQDFGLGTSSRILYHNGKPVFWDANMPANTGYVLNLSQMGLNFQPKVSGISADEVDMDMSGDESGESGASNDWFEIEVTYGDDRRTVRVSATLACQFWFNPRYLVQLFAGT